MHVVEMATIYRRIGVESIFRTILVTVTQTPSIKPTKINTFQLILFSLLLLAVVPHPIVHYYYYHHCQLHVYLVTRFQFCISTFHVSISVSLSFLFLLAANYESISELLVCTLVVNTTSRSCAPHNNSLKMFTPDRRLARFHPINRKAIVPFYHHDDLWNDSNWY
jgi:hypothetical protein